MGGVRERAAGVHDAVSRGGVSRTDERVVVVRGRRGHYQFCDQLTAFDLATGAYYASKSCSGLALRTNGAVDAAKTDAARTPVIQTGRVSVDNLREAAWIIMLAPHVDATGYASASTFPIPPGLDVKVAIGDVRGGSAGSAWGSSAQTRLAWTWIDGAAIVADGILDLARLVPRRGDARRGAAADCGGGPRRRAARPRRCRARS